MKLKMLLNVTKMLNLMSGPEAAATGPPVRVPAGLRDRQPQRPQGQQGTGPIQQTIVNH